NNLANINTPGFKQNRAVFQDLIYQKLAPTGQFGSALLSDADPARELADELGTGVKLSSTPRSFAPGSLIQDGDPLHVAIEGEGFFVVRTADGGAAYTRDGSFEKDAVGRLVTRNGDVVLPETRIPPDARDVRIDSDGIIYARLGDQSGDDVEAQL